MKKSVLFVIPKTQKRMEKGERYRGIFVNPAIKAF